MPSFAEQSRDAIPDAVEREIGLFAHSMAWPRIGDVYFEMIHNTLQASAQQREVRTVREPAAASAFRSAYEVTQDNYLRRMREAFGWFLGDNRLGLPLYDFATGGCRDGIGVSEINPNQGAESTICFLMSLLRALEVAAEGVDARSAAELSSVSV